jgi:TRAP-type mannitol/chloroaromatic compound transport system permease small subunit
MGIDDIETIIGKGNIKTFSKIIVAVIVIGVAGAVIRNIYDIRVLSSQYWINQYQLYEFNKKYPDVQISKI